MTWQLTIGKRLGLASTLTLALMLGILAAGIVCLDWMAGKTRWLAEQGVERYALAMQWERGTAVNVARAVALLRSSDAGFAAELKRDMQATTSNISAIQKKLEALITTPEGKAGLEKVAQARTAYLKARTELTRRKEGGEVLGTAAIDTELRPPLERYMGAMAAVVSMQKQQFETDSADAQSVARNGKWLMAGLGALAALLAMLLAWRTAVHIVGRLHDARDVAQQVAAGNLAVSLDARGADEVGELLRALGQMTGELERTVGGVRGVADAIARDSAQIAQGNQALSAHTEQQASALAQTSASMHQLDSTVRQNAESALQANELSRRASEVAHQGGEVVGEVIDTMKSINDSSSQIAHIIGVIDGIAFQTNLLALNAAVEAARAGEQGRGFAVVAGEVRSLAGRTAEAAREVKQLISTSTERAERGRALVDRAGSTMREIVESIGRVTAIMAEISTASAEQSRGVSQVGQAVSQMDQATQQNAALVEQTAAAAEDLRQRAANLNDAVAVFRLRSDRGVPA